jgi:hypothetical protein
MRQTERDVRDPAVGGPTDAWAFALPAGWARLRTEAGVVYSPTVPVAGMSVPAAITEVEIFGEAGRSPIEVVAGALGEGCEEAAPRELDGRPAVRVARTLRGMPGEAPEGGGRSAVTTRQVAYVVSRDEAEGDWLVLSFSTTFGTGPGSGLAEQLAETLVDFFDAVMTTFRWTGPGTGPVDLPERTIPGSV